VLQRKCACGNRAGTEGECPACAARNATLQRKPASIGGATEVPSIVDEVLRTPGQPLDAATRGDMEAHFGQDFSGVRIHTDATAAESARSVNALAYTVGRDVVFGSRQFAPSSAAGRHLLAHELAHVAQQGAAAAPTGGALQLGAVHDAHEAAADRAADALAGGGKVEAVDAAPANTVRRAPLTAPLTSYTPPLASVEVGANESATKDNPKLVQVADAYRANVGGAARVKLSAYLTAAAKNSSTQETAERSRLNARMRAIREALKALGVPDSAIDLSPADGYSTSANGQVAVDVSKGPLLSPLLLPPSAGPATVPPAAAPAPQQSGSGLPSLDLDLKFGPVTVSLPKEARVKLPIALQHARSLVIELAYEVPAKFSFKITLDGTPHVRVSLKAGAEVDAKNASVTGSAGLQIDSVATTCNAPDPGETREKIKSAGDKLNKSAQEFGAATGKDKLGKAFEIASAIGEMYDAVDKAKSKCKQVSRASIELGYKHLLSPGSETDPKKLPPADYVGVTGTFHF
jgi:hypothetical protein